MDVFELLKRDHTRIAALITRLLDQQELGERKIAFSQLSTELTAHAEMEESLLYPLLERYSADGLVGEAYHAHYQVMQQLEAVESAVVGSTAWLLSVLTLQQMVDDLVRMEETMLFPRAETVIAPDHALQLGQESSRLKQELMGIRY
jgi:iron-sulfur cluster repair protein YtfE (RIC family)